MYIMCLLETTHSANATCKRNLTEGGVTAKIRKARLMVVEKKLKNRQLAAGHHI